MRNSRRTVGLTVCLMMAAFGLAGCGAPPPIGLRKDGENITVVLGSQCRPGKYLRELSVSLIDEKTKNSVTPPMWEIETQEPRLMREIGINEVPDGFVVTVDNRATQAFDKRIDVSVYFGDRFSGAVFELADLQDGKILAHGDHLSEKEFQEEFGCAG
jgi:hypothetical protein